MVSSRFGSLNTSGITMRLPPGSRACGDNAFDPILGVNRNSNHLNGKGVCGSLNGGHEVLDQRGCCWIEQQRRAEVRGAISFNSCTHFPPSTASPLAWKPVM